MNERLSIFRAVSEEETANILDFSFHFYSGVEV